MERLRNALVSFGLNFSLGFALGRLVGDNRTGIRAGVVLGGLGAAGSWLLTVSSDDPAFDDKEPIQIEID